MCNPASRSLYNLPSCEGSICLPDSFDEPNLITGSHPCCISVLVSTSMSGKAVLPWKRQGITYFLPCFPRLLSGRENEPRMFWMFFVFLGGWIKRLSIGAQNRGLAIRISTPTSVPLAVCTELRSYLGLDYQRYRSFKPIEAQIATHSLHSNSKNPTSKYTTHNYKTLSSDTFRFNLTNALLYTVVVALTNPQLYYPLQEWLTGVASPGYLGNDYTWPVLALARVY